MAHRTVLQRRLRAAPDPGPVSIAGLDEPILRRALADGARLWALSTGTPLGSPALEAIATHQLACLRRRAAEAGVTIPDPPPVPRHWSERD